jgi:hypothetical protein
MTHEEHDISLEEILATADLIDRTVAQLRDAQTSGGSTAPDLMSGEWQTPGASTTFQNKWAEWTTSVTRLLQVGPEFSLWLRNYARDAQGLDGFRS